jgi:hypothetical protein
MNDKQPAPHDNEFDNLVHLIVINALPINALTAAIIAAGVMWPDVIEVAPVVFIAYWGAIVAYWGWRAYNH